MADYIVGDIQGCYSALRRLLDKADFNPRKDKLWAVGDLIARGPDSLKTLDYLYSLGDAFDTVLGNHDLHFMAIYSGIKQAKKSDNLDTLLASPKAHKFVNWLRQKPLATKVGKHNLISHAGLYPTWSFKQALALSKEIEQQLQSDNYLALLSNMYGSENIFWQDDLAGDMRMRFIINAFTRMRFLTHDLELEFATKAPPKQAPDNLLPWFNGKNKQLNDKQRVFFGHWAALMGKTNKHQFIGLDTGFVWGHCLTLYHLKKDKRISVRA